MRLARVIVDLAALAGIVYGCWLCPPETRGLAIVIALAAWFHKPHEARR